MENVKNASVLFVDDEEDILDVLKKEFRSTLKNIYLASNGNDALKIVQDHELDLVVLDFKMPGMSGLDLFLEIKKIKPRMPAIFLSGHGDKEIIQDTLKHGAANFIDKPYDSEYLQMAIDRVIEKARAEKLLREVLELFLFNYSKLDISKFDKMSHDEQEKTIRAALGLARIQLLNKNRE